MPLVCMYIKSNYILHLDGVQARPPKNSIYNNGNVPFELQILNNTVISTLGKYLADLSSMKVDKVKLSDTFNTSNRIMLEGYVKTNISTVHNNKLNKIIGCGSITDGTYKLEVHVINFVDDDYYEMDIHKGDKIEVVGMMSNTSPVYLIVNSVQDIKKLEGHMTLPLLLKGTRTVKKRKR